MMRSGTVAWAVASAVAMAVLGALIAPAVANGVNQREIQGRVVSVDTAGGTLVIARAFRGKTTEVTLKAASAIRVYSCAEPRASLERVKKGMVVSAFYEVVGADGVVNLIVIEPGP
jgi:hypothetical protein